MAETHLEALEHELVAVKAKSVQLKDKDAAKDLVDKNAARLKAVQAEITKAKKALKVEGDDILPDTETASEE